MTLNLGSRTACKPREFAICPLPLHHERPRLFGLEHMEERASGPVGMRYPQAQLFEQKYGIRPRYALLVTANSLSLEPSNRFSCRLLLTSSPVYLSRYGFTVRTSNNVLAHAPAVWNLVLEVPISLSLAAW